MFGIKLPVTLVPEFLFFLFEYPVCMMGSWFAFCYFILCDGILSLIFWAFMTPLMFVASVIGYLFLASNWPLGNENLAAEY